MLPPEDIAATRALCARRAGPGSADDGLEVVVDGNTITIVERRAPWMPGGRWTTAPVARLRWTASRRTWTLQQPRNGGWRRYEGIGPTPTIGPLLDEIDRDPWSVFWG